MFITNTLTSRKCSQCGSDLILISKTTETREGSRFPQTTSIYRCSNTACQEEKDKQTAKRVKMRDDRKVEDDKRAQKKLDDKNEKKSKLE